MTDILSITAPIYLLLAAGWLAGRLALFDKPAFRIMGRFVLQVALPALIFKALASRPLRELFDAGYLLAVAIGSLVVFGLLYGVSRWMLGKPRAAATIKAMGSSFSNTGFIGYPIALQFMGPLAGVAMALNLLVENLLMMPLVLALAETGDGSGGRRQVLRQALANLVRNPLVLAIASGVAVSALSIGLPAPLWRTIDMMAAASAPLALFVVGGTLAGLSTQGLKADVARIASAKLVLHPLAVYAALWLVPPVQPQLRALAVVMAGAPMLGVYPILAQKYGLEGPAAAALLGTTVLSFVTISGWLWLVGGGHLPWP